MAKRRSKDSEVGPTAPQRSETADVGLGVELEGDHDQSSAHRAAYDVGLARCTEALAEVLTQGLSLGIGLRESPPGLRIGALNDGVVTLEERLLVACEALSDVEGDRLLRVAVIVDDEFVVPVVRNIDAVGCAVESSDLSESQRRPELNGCRGRLGVVLGAGARLRSPGSG